MSRFNCFLRLFGAQQSSASCFRSWRDFHTTQSPSRMRFLRFLTTTDLSAFPTEAARESIVHCFASVLPSRTIPAQFPSSIISPFAKIKIDFQRHPAAFAESRFFHDLADNSITAWSHAPVASCDFTDGHSTGKLERSRCISFPISAFYGGVGWHIFQKPAPFPETGTESAAFENFAIHNAVFGD